MTTTELLAATGNIWKVHCYRDGNRRRFDCTVYVRASDVLRAENEARDQTGCRCVDAKPWDPRKDRSVDNYVVAVD